MATSYANAGGTGARTGMIAVSGTASLGGSSGPYQRLVNGDTTTDNGSHSIWFSNGQMSKTVTFDFRPLGAPQVITEAKLYQDSATGHGTWKWRGSMDAVSFTDIGAGTFTLVGGTGGSVIGDLSGNSTPYNFYQLFQTAGATSDGPWIREFEFKLEGAPVSAGDTDYANPGGQGDRTGDITVTTTAGTAGAGGTVDNLVDGGTGANASDSWSIAAAQSGKEIVFDFTGFAAKQVISEAKLFADVVTNYDANASKWKWQTSDDGSTKSDLGSNGDFFLIGSPAGSVLGDIASNTTGFWYYHLVQTVNAGTDTTPWNEEVEFRIADAAAGDEDITADMTGGGTMDVTIDHPSAIVTRRSVTVIVCG